MSDNVGMGTTPADSTPPAESGLIDVSGMTFEELAELAGTDDLSRALDYVLASGQNGSGYHGFNSRI